MARTRTLTGALRRYFGFDTFKGDQEAIIKSVLEGKNTFVLMPTGGGKSLCYQLPALLMEGVAIVISPLIALMKNQVDFISHLSEQEGTAHFLNSSLNKTAIDHVKRDIVEGRTKLLYVAPESLTKEENTEFLRTVKISFYAIDEAHCISEWGHDFRPEYRRIRPIINEIGDAPVIALTATATDKVRTDIKKNLGIMDAVEFKSSFNRPNLYYEVRPKTRDIDKDIVRFIKQHQGKSGIIYCLSRKKVEDLAEVLRANDIKASAYHAGLETNKRSETQDDFIMERIDVIVATIAFGMGIDKPDVRFVAHCDVPDSPEAYFQEAGRAGRDGLPSYAVLIWDSTDIARLRQLQTLSFPTLEYIEDIYQKLHVFYQIPYDQGQMRQLKFSLEEFCRAYGLSQPAARSALHYLERSGHISWTEDTEISTQVRILVSRSALYETDLPEPRMVDLLEHLMRGYVGIFDYTVTVNDSRLAASMGMEVPDLHRLLYRLSLEHVIRYIPGDRSDVILLHHDRLAPGNVDLKPSEYGRLKEMSAARSEAMIKYAQEDDECRSRYLLRYFGQTESKDCGGCDVCRSRRRQDYTRQQIRAFMQAHPSATVSEVRAFCANPGGRLSPDAIEIYRSLLDEE